ncbi:MAG: hypothetical protein HZA79_05375 [Sphingobacteriales bacterium]|nr:hypothetical protein [Sphingobacteriales bacterium]
MLYTPCRQFSFTASLVLFTLVTVAQNAVQTKYNNSSVYTGIEVGSKGVKMSIIEIGKNAQSTGAFNILKDTSVNTDFISFSRPTFTATLEGFCGLYFKATRELKIPGKKVFTVISSGVKMQAEKENKSAMVQELIDSFRVRIGEPAKEVEVVDVLQEARLSHLGIVPDKRRFTTFLIDIGSGNTKGGYFPDGTSTTNFRLFQLNWGTKSTFNDAEKRCDGDMSLPNFTKNLGRTLLSAENADIIYAVNASGAYPLSDNIAVSGGIAWATATLLHPELIDNPVISITFDELVKFNEKLVKNFPALSPDFLVTNINNKEDKERIRKEISRVHKVFDQKSLMSGAGLLWKIMRQFESAFETKHFYLVKNGQVGWVSAYVDQTISN